MINEDYFKHPAILAEKQRHRERKYERVFDFVMWCFWFPIAAIKLAYCDMRGGI